ncbi:hypothetical protein Pcinc_032395 [Petrolisthes cinctipes]|uniref:Zinc finger CCHC-type and RNA-binding motif-containing protein 1 n=1 Tax=Petrolisthes cinctipes TaxID=88211 RepID=A0AAE1EUF7_PETCI|nr:hypothetical protein Pcinc_032395 [Petrolisthes cinctipes]
MSAGAMLLGYNGLLSRKSLVKDTLNGPDAGEGVPNSLPSSDSSGIRCTNINDGTELINPMLMASLRGATSRGSSLAPSSSTVYVSNLPFVLTNTDLHKMFEKFGKLVRVTIMKDKDTRKSRGVAFVLFLQREDAQACVRGTNGCTMFGRTLKASIAVDNGRAPEFIKRREYPDKSKCYECGEAGHLSYSCPQNLLGDRDPPKKKSKKRKHEQEKGTNTNKCQKIYSEENDEDDTDENFEDESLSAAIRYQQELRAAEAFQGRISSGEQFIAQPEAQGVKIKKSSYFSDEEEISDS